ncbi:MAG: CPBP family intramembrane metalloprotease [Desulfatibacillum sp.]|nr:CPBP family intramembrane metalloprotease [Desulfatibacillum sp.]
MKKNAFAGYDLLIAISVAALLWFFSFSVDFGQFWVKIVFSALCLAGLAAWLGSRKRLPHFDASAIVLGAASATVLYAVFWIGGQTSGMILPFASQQISGIYTKVLGPPTWVLVFLLFFITGPCEEIFWRGYVQDKLMNRLGSRRGWVAATILYAGLHLVTFNFMLIAAAAVAGAFWGFMYMRNRRLAPLIISHSLWSVFAFAVIPIMAPVS